MHDKGRIVGRAALDNGLIHPPRPNIRVEDLCRFSLFGDLHAVAEEQLSLLPGAIILSGALMSPAICNQSSSFIPNRLRWANCRANPVHRVAADLDSPRQARPMP